MLTLDVELQKMSCAIDASLISAEWLSGVGEAVHGLPSALTSQFGFECPLGSPHPIADFGLRVSSLNERSVLANASADHALPKRLLEQPVWRRLRHFGAAWTNPADALADELKQIWIEFDVRATRLTDTTVPSVHLLIQRCSVDANRYCPDVERSLALLNGAKISPDIVKTVRRCLDLAPKGPRIWFFLGMMFGRRTSMVRIGVRGMSADDVPDYLNAVKWPGPRDAACAALLPIARRAERVMLDIDAGDHLGPKIGLECGFASDNNKASVMELANALVVRDLCVPKKSQALIGWADRVFDGDEDAAPPAHLAGALYLSGLRAHARLLARVNHVKINFECGRLEAKAYFSLERRWQVQL